MKNRPRPGDVMTDTQPQTSCPRGPLHATTWPLIQPRCTHPPRLSFSPACLASLLLRKPCSQSWLCTQSSTAGQEPGELEVWTGSHCKCSVCSKGKFAASESFGDSLAELIAFLTAGVGLVREDEVAYDVRAGHSVTACPS